MDQKKFWLKLLFQTIAILVTATLFDGIIVENIFSAFFAALILGFLNTMLRPVLLFFTLPFTFLSFGLFIFVINAIILKLTAFFIPGFIVQGFFTSIFGAIVISIVSLAINTLSVGENNSIEVIDLKKGRDNNWK